MKLFSLITTLCLTAAMAGRGQTAISSSWGMATIREFYSHIPLKPL